jgi:sec-independent protein translocase protein TatC
MIRSGPLRGKSQRRRPRSELSPNLPPRPMSEPPADHDTAPAPTPSEDEAFADIPPAEPPAHGRDHLERKPFLEHLSDLRLVLIRIAAVFFVCMIGSFAALKPITGLLRMPLERREARKGLEPGTIELITLGPQDGFIALMTIAFAAAIGLTLPFAVYFLTGFIAPALTGREKRTLAPGLIVGVLLFVAGVIFAFFITAPFVMNFLWSLYERLGWGNTWTVRGYFGFLARFLLVTGLTFELPLVLVVLVRLEVLTIRQLRHYRRHAIIAILLVSAVFTPPDAASMFTVAGPMYLLYEASIVASILVERRRRKRAR